MKYLKLYGAQIFGPFLFFILLCSDFGLSSDQQNFVAIFSLVVFYWLFSSYPLWVSGMLGVCLSIALKIATPAAAFESFAHPIIFLFLGGFLLAKAFNNVGLDQRISLYLLTRKFIKGSFLRFLIVIMGLTSIFSMWISNTATTAMMLPLVLGTLKSLNIQSKKTISLTLLAMAYASSIGGIATPIGSTPNAIALGMLDQLAGVQINFFEWMYTGLPIAFLFLVFLFLIIKYQIRNEEISMDTKYLEEEFHRLPTFSYYELYTCLVFCITVFLWTLPSFAKLFNFNLGLNLNSGMVSVFMASTLFLLPFKDGKKVLDPHDVKHIDWSSLLLFGTGLSLGGMLFNLNLAEMLSNILIVSIQDFNFFIIILIIFSFVIFSTELTSNTATANILIPIIISLAVSLKMSPIILTMGVAISCSLAFMLPVATPPNAIVYGSEEVPKLDMIKQGIILNISFAILLSLVFWLKS